MLLLKTVLGSLLHMQSEYITLIKSTKFLNIFAVIIIYNNYSPIYNSCNYLTLIVY